MVLKYFSLNDSKDALKKRYKQLAMENHPDRNLHRQKEATTQMQDINAEFEYCLKNGSVFTEDVRNGANLGELIFELFGVMLDELIEQEKNKSVVDFLKNMKMQFVKNPKGLDDFMRVLWNVGNHIRNSAYKHPYEKIKKKKNPYSK